MQIPILTLRNGTSFSSVELIVFAFFFGACIAAFAAVIHRRTTAALIRYLLSQGAESPETGKTLREAELEQSLIVRLSLRRGSALGRIVAKGEPEINPKTKKPFGLSDTPLYILPESKERAERMYRSQGSEGANLWLVLVGILLFGLIAYLCTLVIPYLMSWIGALFGSQSG